MAQEFVTTFEQDDLYAFNRLINKLRDAGYDAAVTAMVEVRDGHFDGEGAPDSLNHNANTCYTGAVQSGPSPSTQSR